MKTGLPKIPIVCLREDGNVLLEAVGDEASEMNI